MFRSCSWALACAILLANGTARADKLILAEGGQLGGQLQESKTPGVYAIKTDEGAIIVLRRDQVREVVRQRPDEVEYERIRPGYADTAEDQWKLAEWCRQHDLPAARKTHLERVVALDGEHEAARRALGQVRYNGRWATPDEEMTRRGYVRHKGKWMLPQAVELEKENLEIERKEREWTQKVGRWTSWLGTQQGEEGRENILGIKDPMAVRALAKNMAHPNPAVRTLTAQVLGGIHTVPATQALAAAAIEDPLDDVRLTCLEQLKPRKSPAAVDYFVKQLRSRSNETVNRAGKALELTGDASAVRPLIDALVTTHKFKVTAQQPGQIGATFSSAGGGGLSMGGGPRIISRTFQNRDVLDALAAITGKNYGFDVRAWRAMWQASQQQREPLDARRG